MTIVVDTQFLSVPQVFYNSFHNIVRFFVLASIISKAKAYQITNERDFGYSLKVLFGKKQRDKDRVAARVALEQMKKTVHIYEDVETVKEIERLRCVQFFCPNPLEMLGLYLKDDYMEGEEEEEDI